MGPSKRNKKGTIKYQILYHTSESLRGLDYMQVDEYTLLWFPVGVLDLKVVQGMVEDHQGMAYFVVGIERVQDKLVLVEDIQDMKD